MKYIKTMIILLLFCLFIPLTVVSCNKVRQEEAAQTDQVVTPQTETSEQPKSEVIPEEESNPNSVAGEIPPTE